MPLTEHISNTASTGLKSYTGSRQEQLQYRFWSSNTAYPVLVYVHGIEGHSQWFDRAAAQLSQRGINVYAADRRGAGLNKGADCSLLSRTVLLSDLSLFLSEIKRQHPSSDLYLLGNCWGGTLSILYAKEVCQSQSHSLSKLVPINGLILSCPAIKTFCDVSLPIKLAIGWSYLCHSNQEFPFPLTPEMFTKNPQYLKFICEDNLRTTAAYAGFLIETIKMQYLATRAAAELNLPILLLQAENDAIVDKRAVAKWFKQIKSPGKQFFLFAGADHSLDFEPDIFDYLDKISSWITRS
jgi:lysophospholipase